MMNRKLIALFFCWIIIIPASYAEQYKASDLGGLLTPLGAIKAGSTDGSIPRWQGGISKPIDGYKQGDHHPDPFAGEKILFSISAINVEKYASRLSPGQIAMLKQYPELKLNVYPTHRSAAAPKRFYDETIKNVSRAKLVDNGNGVDGTAAGIPFPIPQNGLQAIWNHILRYRGVSFSRDIGQAAVTADGDYTMLRYSDLTYFLYNNPKYTTQNLNNGIFDYLQQITAPARLAGRILLAHETIDAVKEPRLVWIYNPGLRRVRRAPEVAYDSPPPGTDGLRTVDQFDMFNGAPDRYNWKLVGRQEMYVPYNSYQLYSDKLRYKDILQKGHLNPAYLRYELHRVWKVEARLKPGKRHIYARRTFYIDEDSWQILVVDQYDDRGEIWRVSEAYPIVYYEVPVFTATLNVHYDLQSRRYLAFGLNNEYKAQDFSVNLSPGDFNPSALRRRGRR